MPIGFKILFTVSVCAATLLILFRDIRCRPDPDWRWRLCDPLRGLWFHEDGTMRKHAKAGILLCFAVLLFLVWVVL